MTDAYQEPADRPDYPVIFVSGLFGFARLGVGPVAIAYFRRLASALGEDGIDAHFPTLLPTGTVAARATKLADYLATLDAPRIGLVGHSMGGLDCRYLVSRLDPKRRVRFVSTVATPHRGTPVATWALQSRDIMARAARALGGQALKELTPEICAERNAVITDRDDVIYHSYAGSRPTKQMPPWYRPLSNIFEDADGDNDSQVPVQSAKWGEFQREVRADHLELAGWSLAWPARGVGRPFDHIAFYRALIARAHRANNDI